MHHRFGIPSHKAGNQGRAQRPNADVSSDEFEDCPSSPIRCGERHLAQTSPASVYRDARDTPFSQRFEMDDEITDAELARIDEQLSRALGELELSDEEYMASSEFSPLGSSGSGSTPPAPMGMRRYGNVSNLAPSCGSGSTPSPSYGMRRAENLSNLVVSSEGGSATPDSIGMRRFANDANRTAFASTPGAGAGMSPQGAKACLDTFTDWDPFENPITITSPVFTPRPPSSPEWENGEVRINCPSQYMDIARGMGKTGRSASFNPYQRYDARGAAAQADPQLGAEMTPYVHNVRDELECARDDAFVNPSPSPGDPNRSVVALDVMMRTADEITGHLRWVGRSCNQNQQPTAIQRLEHCIRLFQTISHLYKDCTFELSPEVYTVANAAANLLIVATRRVDRNVTSLASTANKLESATLSIIRAIDRSRQKKSGQPSDFTRRLQEARDAPPSP